MGSARRNMCGCFFAWPHMRRVIYISESRIGDCDDEVAKIIEQSERRNAEAGITGLLWFDGANLVQALEGEALDVAMTMERIYLDPRHSSVEVVSARDVTTRMFGGWSMRHAGTEPATAEGTAYLIGYVSSVAPAAASRVLDVIAAAEQR